MEKNKEKINTLLPLIIVLSGIFGFIYETIFYKIDLGYFVKRGTTFGPWIPIYGFGGLFIAMLTYKYKNKPWLVFVLCTIICGVLEFFTGYFLFHFKNIRLWDYNTEIWNFGNIGGYICLRSILFFGISGLFLIYVIIPTLNKIKNKFSKKSFNLISYTLCTLFILDFITNIIMKKI